ncbi:MAG: DUF2199 domain-containing protein [Propionibacteriaceae bacterium]|jgi:hypothetical protein|nr:DUF2199 domain-containing protein [Propionibacteriaceae bacterium]
MCSAAPLERPELCPECQLDHSDVVWLLGPSAPDAWTSATTGERMEAELTPDICILPYRGRMRFFIRGHIQLPIAGRDPFVWSVWAEVDEAAMDSMLRTWNHPNRAGLPQLAGRIANELPYEQPTRELPVMIANRDPGMVPLLMVSKGCGHVLAWEQRDGVTQHRVAQLAERLAHLC